MVSVDAEAVLAENAKTMIAITGSKIAVHKRLEVRLKAFNVPD